MPFWFVVMVTLIMVDADMVGVIALLWMIQLCEGKLNEYSS